MDEQVGRRERSRIREVERASWRVRWFAIPFALAQSALFTPTAEGVTPPVDLLLAGVAIAAALLVTQGIALVAMRAPVQRSRRLGYAVLGIDTVVALSVPVIYAFDHMSTFWPILVFPIIEGAMRAGMGGAMAVWAVGSAGFVANSIRILDTRPNPESWIGSMPWATGILLMVALSTGALGSRVASSDRAVDGWRSRLLRLTSRTDQLARLRTAPEIWAETLDLAARIVDEVDVAVQPAGSDDVPPWLGPSRVDEEVTTVLVPGDDEGPLGEIHVRITPDDLAPDDRTMLDLLARHAATALLLVAASDAERTRTEGLEVLAQQKNEFLTMLAHELRSPMTVIAGNARVLETHRALEPEVEARVLQMIGDNISRLQHLVDDASDVMRVDASELPVSVEPVVLGPVVREVVAGELAEAPGHTPVVDLPVDLRKVLADPQRVQQVLHNLLSNAVRYSPDGGIVAVTVRVVGDRVDVAVTDEGIGIPADRLPRLFGRLERLHPELGIRGTGLGLYLSRELARAMGGDLRASTVPGEGSTFTLSLPLAPADVADPPVWTPSVADVAALLSGAHRPR